jgi:hypothetical protein
MTCFGLIQKSTNENDQYEGEAALVDLVKVRIGSPLYGIMAC